MPPPAHASSTRLQQLQHTPRRSWVTSAPHPHSPPRRELPRPYLLSTVRELERRTGRCGRALVACVAARRVHLPWVDLEPLAAGCAAHLAGDSAAVDTATRRFVACALGLGEQRGNTRVEAHDTHCG